MNDDLAPDAAADTRRREHPDPTERDRPVPRLLLAGVAALFLWGVGYIVWTQRDDAPALGDGRTLATLAAPTTPAAVDGAQLYAAHCAACHQAGGAGLPGVFPPLAGSEWVAGPPARLAALVLHGVQGRIEVRGAAYDGQMPAFGATLGDAELAAVLTHVRGGFGNAAALLRPADVAAARAATSGRNAPWKGGDELATVE